jgi:hypothetical protein
MTDNLSMRKALIERFVYSVFFVFATANVSQADHNKMLQHEYRTGISRHVACDSQGYCYLLLPLGTSEGNSGFVLKVSRKPNPQRISEFPTTIRVPKLRPTTARVLSAGLSIDSQDRIHLIWTTENGLTAYSLMETQSLRNGNGDAKWLHPVSRQKGGLVVAPGQSWSGDICRSSHGGIWLTWTTNVANTSEVIVYLGALREGEWQSFELDRGKKLYPPSMAISQDGTSFHIACGDTTGGTHALHGKFSELGTNRQWKLQATYPGRRPALVEINNRVLAVHESGDSLKYTFLEPGVTNQPSQPLTDLDSRLVWDTVHSPRLIVDQHGVPWVFFIDSTRQHVFYSRWLGTRWSPILNGFWITRNTARFEDNHLSIDWLGVEHGHGTDKSSIALTIGHRSQAPKARFDLLPVPSLKSDAGNKVLFLDLKEVQHIDGIALKVNAATKLADPVVVGGDPGDFDSQGASKLAVIKQDGVYRAWYTGMHRKPDSKWPESGPIPYVRVGYAESKDGIRFEKPPLGLSSFGDKDNTNIVAGLPTTPIYRPVVPTGMHIDTADPDPSRRYKFLTWTGGRPARTLPNPSELDEQTWTLWTSADGLRWKMASKGGIRFPGGMPASFSPQSMFHDPKESDPAKKYKAYGFLGLNNDRRGAGYGYSHNAIEWTADPRNPVFDAWARATSVVRGGKVQQIHDAVVWKYHQYYLALYQYQRRGDDMAIELAMSRDGETFVYIQPGSEVVRRGAAGEWDCDMIGPSVPLVDEDEIKVYYSGYRFSKTKLIEGEHACGLATLRLDGFTHVTLEEGREQGTITTIPVDRGAATELLVNASCTDDNRIKVELVDPNTGEPLPRFSRKECTIIKTDSLAHRVSWGRRQLADVGKASFQIRFHLTGRDSSPELYSLEFR